MINSKFKEREELEKYFSNALNEQREPDLDVVTFLKEQYFGMGMIYFN